MSARHCAVADVAERRKHADEAGVAGDRTIERDSLSDGRERDFVPADSSWPSAFWSSSKSASIVGARKQRVGPQLVDPHDDRRRRPVSFGLTSAPAGGVIEALTLAVRRGHDGDRWRKRPVGLSVVSCRTPTRRPPAPLTTSDARTRTRRMPLSPVFITMGSRSGLAPSAFAAAPRRLRRTRRRTTRENSRRRRRPYHGTNRGTGPSTAACGHRRPALPSVRPSNSCCRRSGSNRYNIASNATRTPRASPSDDDACRRTHPRTLPPGPGSAAPA